MTNYKEIVTKAVLSKAKRLFTTTKSVSVENPSTILGCWVINHNFNGTKRNQDILIDGSYDVNIWYSYDNDTKTNVVKETNQYHEVIHMRDRESHDGEEVIIRSLKQPSCVKADLDGNTITYVIEKELGIELVGDVKVKIEVNGEEDPWDEILEENVDEKEISTNIEEDFIKEELI
ncbi:MAG: outer spore coat protein CotE [Bacilli bacterium]|nr:outer spore coat protein CotE [Bacilli bacterium]